MSSNRVKFLSQINNFLVDSELYLNGLLSKLNWSEKDCLKNHLIKNSFEVDKDIVKEKCSAETNIPCIPTQSLENDISNEIPKIIKEEKSKSVLELLALQRDLKRRRVSYKGRVHTKNRSHNEILRGVIAQQMEALEESLLNDSRLASNDREDPDFRCGHSSSGEIIDLSRIRVLNPHLAWKQVAEHVHLEQNINKSSSLPSEDAVKVKRFERNSHKRDKSESLTSEQIKVQRNVKKVRSHDNGIHQVSRLSSKHEDNHTSYKSKSSREKTRKETRSLIASHSTKSNCFSKGECVRQSKDNSDKSISGICLDKLSDKPHRYKNQHSDNYRSKFRDRCSLNSHDRYETDPKFKDNLDINVSSAFGNNELSDKIKFHKNSEKIYLSSDRSSNEKISSESKTEKRYNREKDSRKKKKRKRSCSREKYRKYKYINRDDS